MIQKVDVVPDYFQKVDTFEKTHKEEVEKKVQDTTNDAPSASIKATDVNQAPTSLVEDMDGDMGLTNPISEKWALKHPEIMEEALINHTFDD